MHTYYECLKMLQLVRLLLKVPQKSKKHLFFLSHILHNLAIHKFHQNQNELLLLLYLWENDVFDPILLNLEPVFALRNQMQAVE